MKSVMFRAPLTNGRTIDGVGYPTSAPGLLVTASPSRHSDGAECWQVLHAGTFCAVVSYCWGSAEAALAFAGDVRHLTDWEQPGEVIAAVAEEHQGTLRESALALEGRTHGFVRI